MPNSKQLRILELLRSDPSLTQQALADHLNLSRSAVANLITGLIQEGHIVGRAYILADEPTPSILCIGGMNLDTKLVLDQTLHLGTSNPVHATHSPGGVIRNVAENLSRLEHRVSLLSVVGDDAAGRTLLDHASSLMDISLVNVIPKASTGAYQAVIEPNGDMVIGLADMDIMERMDAAWIRNVRVQLKAAKRWVADNNLPQEAMAELIDQAIKMDKPLTVVGVSAPKTARLPKSLKGVDLTIFNRDETQTAFGTNESDPLKLVAYWLNAGVHQTVVTAGTDGVAYGSSQETGYCPVRAAPHVLDATGAGDAFSAGLIHGLDQGQNLAQAVKLGMANAYYTIQTLDSVRKDLSPNRLRTDKEHLYD
jgi:pseudouridine kinase